MQDSIKTMLGILNRAGFQAYYTGDKCRNEYISSIHKIALNKNNDIRIATNATEADIKKFFPHAQHIVEVNGHNYELVEFADTQFKIEPYRKYTYFYTETDKKGKIVENRLAIPQVNACDKNGDLERKVFTIEGVFKEIVNDEDVYWFAKNTENDIKSKVIRTFEKDSKKVLYEYPLNCLKAFVLMSETGFEIDKQVLKDIKSTMRYLRFYEADQMGYLLRRIMQGKFALQTLKTMHKIGILNSKCMSSVVEENSEEENQKEKILFSVHSKDIHVLDVLENFKSNKDTELELWALLFDSAEIAKEELVKFQCFNQLELNTIYWLINNRSFVKKYDNDFDVRSALYSSIGEYEKTQGVHHLKKLVTHACHIFKVVNEEYTKEEKNDIVNKLMYNICCRPYFVNQLTWHVSVEDKVKLIELLLKEETYPFLEEDVDNFIEKHGCTKVGK